ncbi:MAG: hypothetical protein CL910_19030 [Deltaproteobacteria bacterium]|jgi:hypothetical protein|nr:hypothetical protein [Deltaproteobacteria bacterium]
MGDDKASSLRPVLGFFLALALASLGLFLGILWLEGASDLFLHPGEWLARLRPEVAEGTLSNAAEVVAGVLAIAITVVAIVVELAANRYTHRITQLFVREPVNIGVMTLFVITTIQCLWVGSTFGGQLPGPGRFSYAGLVIAMGMVTLCLLVLLPYFAFVFHFLSPLNVIAHIADAGLAAVVKATRGRTTARRADVIEAVDELEDVARGAMTHGDRGIGMAAVDALGSLLRRYAEHRDQLPEGWFRIDGAVARDPDFVSLAASSAVEIEEHRSWLEYKVLRQLHGLYLRALGASRDNCDRIALEVFRIGQRALGAGDRGGVENAIRAFNSFLRGAINAGDLRSAYFVLDQYRSLTEVALERGSVDRVSEIADHLIEYGRFGQERGQHFLVEVVAYDLVQLIRLAVEREPEQVGSLLDRLLSVDEVAGSSGRGKLRGVRRAQAQLGVFMLSRGETAHVATIQKDMRGESEELLAGIHRELALEERDQYWEFTDRGVNFGFVPPEQRAHLDPFFSGVIRS